MSNPNLLHEVLQDPRFSLPALENIERIRCQLELFLGEWERWNGKINLTSEASRDAVIEKHIFDSLQYARVVKKSAIKVMDVGSGAGFPGIPIKIIFPKLDMVLVESQRKRANFLRNVVRALEMENVEVLNQRAEEVPSRFEERFDLILFRGVGDISHCLQLSGRFLKKSGQVAMKKNPETQSPGSLEFPAGDFQLFQEISLVGFSGISSKLMVFQRCFT